MLKDTRNGSAEVLGLERRRRWSDDDKARIVAETLEPGVRILDVARRHQLASSVLHAWRRKMRTPSPHPARLVPVSVAEAPPSSSGGAITIETPRGYRVRVGPDVTVVDLRRVLEALASQ